MSIGTHALAAATAGLSASRRRSTVPGGVVLAYHDVLSADAEPFEYAVSIDRLRQQFDIVDRFGLTVIPMVEMSRRVRAGDDLTGTASILFDDALVGVYQLALPELHHRGWPSTLLPVLGEMDRLPWWWPGSQRTMSSAELDDAVSSALVDVAVHGMTHTCLPCLPAEKLADELVTARSMLTEMAGRDVDEIAYPYGHHDGRVREAVRAAGFTTGYTFLNGRVTHDCDRLKLPRITMHEGLTAPRLAHQLSRRARDWPDHQQRTVHQHAETKEPR